MDGKKRKREDEQLPTVVTFSAPHNRTFDRVLRDQSFSQVKDIVRKKLGLPNDDHLSLVQLRDGREVDLEDEDDYEAFRALSRTTPSLQVLVRVGDVNQHRLPEVAAKSQPIPTTPRHPRHLATQPVAGPSTVTLDASAQEGRDTSVDSPPRKRQKSSDARRNDRAPSVVESLLTDGTEKKRKKRQKSRVPSSGSAADLSSNVPESPAPAAVPGKKSSGPPTVDPVGPSRAVSLQPPSSDSFPAAKSKKRKADVTTANDSVAEPVAIPEPVAASSKSKKRSAASTELVEEPQPKKVKKKAKEIADEPPVSVDASTPAASASDPNKGRSSKEKKSKKVPETDGSTSRKSKEPASSSITTPLVAETSEQGKKKKAAPKETPSAASPVTQSVNGDKAQLSQVAEQPKTRKKSKLTTVDEPASAPSTPEVPKRKSSSKKSMGASSEPTKGSAEPEVEPKKPKATSKAKTKAVILDDTDIMAAVSAVLLKQSSESTPAVARSEPLEQTSPEPRPPQTSSKAITRTLKSRKSRLSQSWGPADIIDESTSDPSNNVVIAAPMKETSVSAVLSQPRFASVRRAPRAPAAESSSASAQTGLPVVGKSVPPPSVSRATSPERPLSVIPAGSEISELVVQGQDEGSSDESEDSDDDSSDEATPLSTKLPHSKSLSRLIPSGTSSSGLNSATLSEVDVEALLRGPVPTKGFWSLIPSESGSEEEEKSESEALASEEEEKEERAYRRMSKRFKKTQASSSDEEPMEDEPLVVQEAVAAPSPTANSDDSEPAVDESIPVESPAPVAAEATNNKSFDASPPSIDVKPAVEQEALRGEASPKEEASVGRAKPKPGPNGEPGNSGSSSSRADAEEVEDIVPTSDPTEADEEDENDQPDPAEAEGEDDQSDPPQSTDENEPEARLEATSELSQEVPYPAEEVGVDEEEEEEDEEEEEEEEANEDTYDAKEEVDGSKEEEEEESAAPSSPKAQMEAESETSPPTRNDVESRSRSISHEDPADPIESAEDLAIPLDMASQDPIEFDPPVPDSDREKSSPPMSTPQRGTAKRMKDRNGKMPTSDALPVLLPQPRQKRSTRSTRNGSQASATVEEPLEDTPSVSTHETDGKPEPTPTPAPRRSARQASVPPQAAPEPPAPAPKRRGRPPATAEEKARKAAEKEAEKQRKAAEKEAEKLRKQEEKKKRDEEKALKKVAPKGRKAPAKKGSASAMTANDEETMSAAVSSKSSQSNVVSTPAKAAVSQDAPSVAKWTALTQTSQTQDPDLSSMVDELRSSSPDLALNATVSARVGANGKEPIDVSMQEDDAEVEESDDESPTVKANGKARPLFIPSDSQYPPPDLQNSSRSHLLSSSQPPSQQSQSQSQSQPQPQSQPLQTGKFKRPVAPVTSWANASKFRRLSDLASQEMFSPLSSLPVPGRRKSVQTAEERRASMYGNTGDDSSSDSDSDSDEENASHIPKDRRAGVHKKELFVE